MTLFSGAKGLGGLALVLLAGCQLTAPSIPEVDLSIQQKWQLQPGDRVAGSPVVGSLGDISILPTHREVYAPFDGTVKRDQRHCLVFESGAVPGYRLRLCGLSQPRFGPIRQGETIGHGSALHVAMLRKQPDGTWAMVEPSRSMLERLVQR